MPHLRRCLALLVCLSAARGLAAPSVVRIQQNKDGFTLTRDGKPYEPKGFGLSNDGGIDDLAAIQKTGANSFRIWGADKRTRALLDEAQRLGLTVCVGIWIEHQSDPAGYRDPAFVKSAFAEVCRTVRAFKDHPAVLMWGIGNEMEGNLNPQSADPNVWQFLEFLAAAAKQLDPNHPTMTTLAEIAGSKVQNLHRYCPDLDLVGINSYGGLTTFPARYRAAGGGKPYLVTEYGPRGPWESPVTDWKAPLEATSTAKAELYRAGYEATAQHDRPGLCLGAYAFLWGHKQEMTATWYGVLLPDGTRLGAVDALQELWTGKPPANRVPRIEALTWTEANHIMSAGELHAELRATDPEGASLDVTWVVRTDDTEVKFAGQAEFEQKSVPSALKESNATSALVRAPKIPGPYRLFVTVKDRHGGAATANLPFLVEKP